MLIFFSLNKWGFCVCVSFHRDAVDSVGSVQCSTQKTQQLKSLAVSAFGDPRTWDEAQVADVGNIIGKITSYFAFIAGQGVST